MLYTNSAKRDALMDRIDEQQQAIDKLIKHEHLQGDILEKIIGEQQATINHLREQQQNQQRLIGMIMGQLEQQRKENLNRRSNRQDVVIERSPVLPYNAINSTHKGDPHLPGASIHDGDILKRPKPLLGRPPHQFKHHKPEPEGFRGSSSSKTTKISRTSSTNSERPYDQELTRGPAYSPKSMVLEEEDIHGYIKSPQLTIMMSRFGDNESGSTSKRRQDQETEEEEAKDQGIIAYDNDNDNDDLYPRRPPLTPQYHETIKKLVGVHRHDNAMDLLKKNVSILVKQLAIKFQLSFDVPWDQLGDQCRQQGVNAFEILLLEQDIPIIRSHNQWIAKGLVEREWNYVHKKHLYRKSRNNSHRQSTAPLKQHLQRKRIQKRPRTKNAKDPVQTEQHTSG